MFFVFLILCSDFFVFFVYIVLFIFEDKLKFFILFYRETGIKKVIYKHIWSKIDNEVIKKTIEPSHNVSHGEVMSIKDLKVKNAREWKHVLEGENGLRLVS